MQTLTEIYRDETVNIHGRMISREAVRAVALRNNLILMVFSPVNGDYKFPGGGVIANESPEVALKREVREECGMSLKRILKAIGCVIEYAIPKEDNFDVFKMTSRYYLCEVDPSRGRQDLDYYEEELAFQPTWLDINSAIQTNKIILETRIPNPPRWTGRDTFMLDYIKTHLS